MKELFSGRALPAAVLAAMTAAVLVFAAKTGPAGLPAPETLAAVPAAAESLLGLPRRYVLNAWGEPDGTLSGLFGDIYALEGGAHVIVYYDTEPMGKGLADGYTVPVEHVKVSTPD